MNYKILLASLVVAQCLAGCSSCGRQADEVVVETFSEATPFTVEIKKERSFFQAEKIAKRLTKMGLGGYVIPEETDDGTWYRIVSGALADSAAVEAYMARLDSSFNIKDVAVVDYAELDSLSRVPVFRDSVDEKHRIEANTPDVPRCIMDVIGKFPESDMFYLNSIGMLTLNKAGIRYSEGRKIDMPRGVTLSFLQSKGCRSLASVVYKDNIYGDNVTLQVVRCKDTVQMVRAGIMPSFTAQNEEAVYLCSEIADKILATGNYEDEIKVPFEKVAYQKLSGFVASFITKNAKRSYYIFTDEAGEYIYTAQSTKNKDNEMFEFIGEIGKSEGLTMYDEFYNSFYTVSDKMEEDEEFLGYYMEKLTWSYARERNYALWAKKMVGHWQSALYFDNKERGCWSYSIFDLLSESQGERIYNVLYRGSLDSSNLRTIYGTAGAAIRNFWGELSEVNFGYGRYVVALGVSGVFSERDIIRRAEALQLEKGGYNADTTTSAARQS